MIALARPWMTLTLHEEMRVLSFAPHRPGFVRARRIVWREVRDADLTEHFDAKGWLAGALAAEGMADAVAMLTSRRLDAAREAREGGAFALATVGLGNAERIGEGAGPAAPRGWGTINIAVVLEAGLSEAGLVEALSLAAAARTRAVMESGRMVAEGPATGTGTDCIAVAAPIGEEDHCGLHTETGRALGRAVFAAVAAGAKDWMEAFGHAQVSP